MAIKLDRVQWVFARARVASRLWSFAMYVALYRYVAELDTVLVLAIHGQKEAGCTST